MYHPVMMLLLLRLLLAISMLVLLVMLISSLRPPQETAPLSLEQILLGYQAGTLARQTDPVLHQAALTLEAAQRNFWTDIDTTTWSLTELAQARSLRMRYAEIEHVILNLLNTRYGCND